MYSFLVAPRNNPLLLVVSACKGKKLRSQAVKPGNLRPKAGIHEDHVQTLNLSRVVSPSYLFFDWDPQLLASS